MSAREYLRVTPETTPGVYNTSGTAVIIDIDAANAYTLRPAPIRQTIRTAGGLNTRAATIAKKMQYNGNLNFTLRGSYAKLLVAWAMPVAGILTSYTIDHAMVQEDTGGTTLYSRTLGVYCQQLQITAGEADQWLKAQLQLVGMNKAVITGTDFPEPAMSAYASGPFLTFEDATGGLTLGSETRMDIETCNVTIKNILDVRFFVQQNPFKIKYCGRDVDWTSRVSMSSSIPRTALEAMTPIAGEISFANGTNTLVLNMETQNYYATITDDIDMNKIYLQELTLESHLDYTAGTDFTMTAT